MKRTLILTLLLIVIMFLPFKELWAQNSGVIPPFLPNPVLPLTGTEIVPIWQNNRYVKATVAEIKNGGGGGGGSVSSVGLSMPGIFVVTNSPVTSSGILTVTASGVSGGIPYFNSSSSLASSLVLSLQNPVIGGGPGGAPTTGTRSGNSTIFATTFGALIPGHVPVIDSFGNFIDSGVTPGSGGITQLTGPVTAGPGTGSQATTITPTGVTAGGYTVSNGSSLFCWNVAASGQITSISSGACSSGCSGIFALQGGNFGLQGGNFGLQGSCSSGMFFLVQGGQQFGLQGGSYGVQ